MGIILAIVVAIGAVGAGAHNGLFHKGADTTRRDTYAFEQNALEEKLESVQAKETKERAVYALDDKSSPAGEKLSLLQTQQEKLKTKIAALEQAQEKMQTAN